MTTVDREEVVVLTESLIDGTISAEEFACLEQWLKTDPTARALYLEHRAVDSSLCWRWQAEGDRTQLISPVKQDENLLSFPAWRTFNKVALAAAAMAVAALMVFSLFERGDGIDRVMATVTAEEDSQWRVVSGDVNGKRTLLVTEGVLEVVFFSGAKASVTGPSLFEIRGDNEAVLEWGKGSFQVPEQAVGYSVDTPWGKVIDLGTAFELDVSNDGLAKVSVTEGEVRVVSKGEQQELSVGGSLTMSRSGLGNNKNKGLTKQGQMSSYKKLISDSSPVAYWPFDGVEGDLITEKGVVKLVPGPRPQQFPLFDSLNTAAFFGEQGMLRKQDIGKESDFDFKNGDEISIEAWVNPAKQMKDGGIVYIVGKGRTNNLSFLKDNQNFSLRLWRKEGQMKATFLFRSAPDGDWEGDFHRWTGLQGFAPGDGWHHVAVTYRYGDPSSIRTYQDGELMPGEWDMGGATSREPVVDDDELWLGAAQGGSQGNKFTGMVDEVAIYRRILSAEQILQRAQKLEKK